jgi:multidrug transporter EmrE-like cation transporter
MKWLTLAAYFALSGFGLFKLKSAAGPFTPAFAAGMAGYAIGFVMWLYMLREMPLSIIFPVAAGGLIVVSQLTGFVLLGEPVSSIQLVGAGAIVLGIVLLYA